VPEGDSIFRAARTLDRALAGRTVTRFESVFPRLTRVDQDHPLRGRMLERVTPRGKHLLMWFSGDLVLHTHMRMKGSWHLYRPGERWMWPRHDMRIVVGTEAWDAVAFNVPTAEFLEAGAAGRSAVLGDLAPDLLSAEFDADEAVRRLEAVTDAEIGEALLDQHALAGIGNIYKSETLFACGVSPFVRVGSLPREMIAKIVSTARRLLQAHAVGSRCDPTAAVSARDDRRDAAAPARESARGWPRRPARLHRSPAGPAMRRSAPAQTTRGPAGRRQWHGRRPRRCRSSATAP
jgi:endonuclease-8